MSKSSTAKRGKLGFDICKLPLQGMQLIEASAGTGKTYSIALLFLRLIIEGDGLPVDAILVVTFTNAAARELRDRLRSRLQEAAQALRGGIAANKRRGPLGLKEEHLDAVLQAAGDHQRSLVRVTAALGDVDRAQISTIHGFCQRVLGEQAFDCGLASDADAVDDPERMRAQVMKDYWRRHLLGLSQEAYAALLATTLPYTTEKKISGEHDLTEYLSNFGDMGTYEMIPEDVHAAARTIESAVRSAADVLTSKKDVALVQAFFATEKVWKKRRRSTSYQKTWISDWKNCFLAGATKSWTVLEAYAECDYGDCVDVEGYQEAMAVTDGCRAKQCQAFVPGAARVRHLLDFYRREMTALKRRQNLRDYADMLLDVRDALRDKELGPMLKGRLRQRFRAALIDEFQDTDGVQFEIFDLLFGDGQPLLLIGDPKQAIYKFRGADIYAYLKAKRHIPTAHRHTLRVNHRSEPALVEGVNAIFSRLARPFLFDPEDVGFPEVRAFDQTRAAADLEANGPRPKSLLEGGHALPAVQLRLFGQNVNGQPRWVRGYEGEGQAFNPYQDRCEHEIAAATASEIVALLNQGAVGEACIGDGGVRPQDVAVLCPTHKQLALVQAALRDRGVPTVLASDRGVFKAEAARDVWLILRAMAMPHNEGRIRAALSTVVFGKDAAEMLALRRDESGWQRHLERFRDYHEAWEKVGLARAFRRLMADAGATARLLARPDGERLLTDILHVIEILHAESVNASLHATGVLALLEGQFARDDDKTRREEQQLRLETDADAVQLLTVHGSKGLEFPIVYLPFAWRGLPKGRLVEFHDPDHDDRRMIDLGSDAFYGRNFALTEREALAEDLRLLYVALTRAVHRVCLTWGAFTYFERSALSYVLTCPDGLPEFNEVAALEARVGALGCADEALIAVLDQLQEASGGKVMWSHLQPADGERFRPDGGQRQGRAAQGAALKARTFERRVVASGLAVTSFSGLTREGKRDVWEHEVEDHDPPDGIETEVQPPTPATDSPFAEFPAGRVAGTCLHEVFEGIRFGEGQDHYREVALEVLPRHGLDGARYADLVARMVDAVLCAPIMAADPAFCLADLRPEQRLAEMNFFVPFQASPVELAAAFEATGDAFCRRLAGRMQGLTFEALQGFLTGFVDLTFEHGGRYYLLDWKSNHLGAALAGYGPERLEDVMVRDLYGLQYYLYILGLDAYLAMRMSGRYRYADHFGGAFYVFLRGLGGVGADGSTGVYFDAPAEAIIKLLRERLLIPAMVNR